MHSAKTRENKMSDRPQQQFSMETVQEVGESGASEKSHPKSMPVEIAGTLMVTK